ncbi:MAG: protein kinase [Flavobacteriales bacterium]|nr:protein kinase [Flavobacteriales bacterium]
MYQRGERISPDLTVQFHIKSGANADTYRVRNEEGSLFFMKVFHRDRMEADEFTENGLIREVEMLRALKHQTITAFVDAGQLDTGNGAKDFLLTTFISGEAVQDRLRRELTIAPMDARRFVLRLLEGLDYLHGAKGAISHNEVTNQNVMLDLSGSLPESVLIDFGHARYKAEGPWRPKQGHDPYYLAPECFDGESGPSADVFAAGVLYYHMLFGIPPWYLNISQYQAQRSDIHSALARKGRTS